MPQSRCFWLKVFSTEPLSALLRPGIACQAVNRSTSFYLSLSNIAASFYAMPPLSFYFTLSVGALGNFLQAHYTIYFSISNSNFKPCKLPSGTGGKPSEKYRHRKVGALVKEQAGEKGKSD